MALVAALAGSAVAEFGTLAKLDRKEKKQTKRIAKKMANKRINKLAPGLSVAEAVNAENADSASPTGTAWGDLSGNYPNPSIANGVVTAAKLADSVERLRVWAVIDPAETLERGTGVADVSAGAGAGSTLVTFNQVVSQCTYCATVHRIGGFATATEFGLTTINVVTRDPTGTAVRLPFHLQVFC